MFLELPYEKFNENAIFIDVRTEMEYEESHIPNSINIPLFTNEERKEIGTAYKQESVDQARRLGVKYASRKMNETFEKLLELRGDHNQRLVAYCARGGYRSTFFSTAFSSIGISVLKMKGGYKAYRKYVMETLPIYNDEVEYIVVHGNTGTGKTDILKNLREKGLDVLDLEGAANHRGSLLGSIGLGECKSQKQFESNILEQMSAFKTDHVYVEAESRRIGKVMVPKYIHEKMRDGKHIFVSGDIDYRVGIIKKDYIARENWKEESMEALDTLLKYMDKSRVAELKDSLEKGDVDGVIKKLMLEYYDPMYMNKSDTYEYELKIEDITDAEFAADRIEEWHKINIL
ncbi:tRNA 2-selenouridine synthase [Dethiosulfatibacter aminovorans DSM 17477]|uniref:tRNA 2-selenouridine synthase n=1 Tax=Dethiosulfatibacter aminovorans DSM 17477 TaxID=1121476 RepID=A0A1M6K4P1_9FIRM|nr:tRNA 2-selenouridine(34) synthase MnmH [Dethiosulfatibacter aminovorans]SHJ53881.1 tRNA 2-selenouridine synthase [Dethiosulfatibacter aminovorans DSM 17477]